MKTEISDSFYWIGLRPSDVTKLGLIFPVDDGEKMLVTNPLTIPMGWNNLTTLFCTATETITYLANEELHSHPPSLPKKLDDRAAAVVNAVSPTLDTTLVILSRDPLLLCTNAQLLAYVVIFVYDLLGLAQVPNHRS